MRYSVETKVLPLQRIHKLHFCTVVRTVYKKANKEATLCAFFVVFEYHEASIGEPCP